MLLILAVHQKIYLPTSKASPRNTVSKIVVKTNPRGENDATKIGPLTPAHHVMIRFTRPP